VQELLQKKPDKPVYEFSIVEETPPSKDNPHGTKTRLVEDDYIKSSFGLVKLDMDEEIQAAERAGKNGARLGYLMARTALVEVDGRRVNKAEGEDEKILRHCDPAIRELILEMYAEISSAPEGASKKVKASMKVKVG
jgi:hypothetical protein